MLHIFTRGRLPFISAYYLTITYQLSMLFIFGHWSGYREASWQTVAEASSTWVVI